MSTIAKVRGGELRTVYDDRWAGILSAIGSVTI